MANQNGRPIAPARKLLAAVLGTIAVFVMLFGLGLSSWSIVALGAALLALAIALAMVNVVRRGARAWISGTAQVKAISDPPSSSVYGRAELQVVVVAPGLPVSEVIIRDPRVPVDRWPVPGDTLPVTVDVDDMRRVRITWDEAPSRASAEVLDHHSPAYDPVGDPTDLPDDLLGENEPPPWTLRERSWSRNLDESPPAPRTGEQAEAPLGSVVVREAPGATVLEGQFVARDDHPGPLPQRARPAPAADTDPPAPAPDTDPPAPDPIDSPPPPPAATAGPSGPAGPRPSGSRPSPRPRAATATLDPDPGTDAPAPDAAPTTAATPQSPAPPPGPRVSPEGGTPDRDHDIDIALDATTLQPDPDATSGPDPDFGTEQPTTPQDGAQPDPQPAGRPWTDLDGGYEPDERADELITAYPSARPGPAAAIHGVGITVLVTDLARSVAFYRDVLGFFEIDSGAGSAVLASGDTRLVLRTVHDLSSAGGRLVHVNLEVGDIDAVYAELKRKGVPFVHAPRPVNRGDRLELWAASFHDPDEHNIAITQWRAID
ncbi:VOC family protein [Krasilnikovia sp. MM14-A1259]|uniref:VOC family protein n=1 Tax=Krasilnikovia sp. MM14-A1259 TaxID=3373539 RepID=UPI0038062169